MLSRWGPARRWIVGPVANGRALAANVTLLATGRKRIGWAAGRGRRTKRRPITVAEHPVTGMAA